MRWQPLIKPQRESRLALLLSLLVHSSVLLGVLVFFSKPAPPEAIPLTIELALTNEPTPKSTQPEPQKPQTIAKLETTPQPVQSPKVVPLPQAAPIPNGSPQSKSLPEAASKTTPIPKPPSPRPTSSPSEARPNPQTQPVAQKNQPLPNTTPAPIRQEPLAKPAPQVTSATPEASPAPSSSPLQPSEASGTPVKTSSSIQAEAGPGPKGQAIATEAGGPVVKAGSGSRGQAITAETGDMVVKAGTPGPAVAAETGAAAAKGNAPKVEQETGGNPTTSRPSVQSTGGEGAPSSNRQNGPVAESGNAQAGPQAVQPAAEAPAAKSGQNPTPAKAEGTPQTSQARPNPEQPQADKGAATPAKATDKSGPVAEAGTAPGKDALGNQGLPSCAIIVDTRGLNAPISRSMSPAVVESSGQKVWPDNKAIQGVSTELVDKTSIALFFNDPSEIQLERYSHVLQVKAIGTQPPPNAPKSNFHDYAVVSPNDGSRIAAVGLSCQMIFLTSR